jgi:hypothetical protein
MLSGTPKHLLSILKKKINDKINVKKITFNISKVLNAQFFKLFFINMLNLYPKTPYSIHVDACQFHEN